MLKLKVISVERQCNKHKCQKIAQQSYALLKVSDQITTNHAYSNNQIMTEVGENIICKVKFYLAKKYSIN